MPTYAYRCPDEHVTEKYFRVRDRIAQLRCQHEGCKKLAKRSIADEGGNVIPDIPDHFNMSLGCGVTSRTHLKELQKKLGVRDYEPQRSEGPTTSWR